MFGFLEGIHIYFNDSRDIEHIFFNTILFLHFVHLKWQDLHQASFMEKNDGFLRHCCRQLLCEMGRLISLP